MVPVVERKIIKKNTQELDSEMDCEIIESYTWQQATVLAYFAKKDNRVEKAVTLPGVTFIPVKGSDMLGILVSEDACMMTCNIGENININNPIDFRRRTEDSKEMAELSFEWNPMYSIYELESNLEKIDSIMRCVEKLDPVYSQTERSFYLVVDKKGIPLGRLYDSTMGKYLLVKDLVMKEFEKEFFARAVAQAKEDKKQAAGRETYLRTEASSARRKFLIGE
jgi:hypothetical protein